MDNFEALVSLNLVAGIGSLRLKKLLEYFIRPQNIFLGSIEQLVAISGISEEIAKGILAFKKEALDKELNLAHKYGLSVVTLEDADYPESLKNIPDPPIVLYIKGKIEKEDKFSLGIVGSRRASFYGLSSAEKFATDLSYQGLTVVSGMARGVDSYAHRGALKAKGRTIAVMGSGFKHIYPPENKKLAQDIAANGAVISEFPINTEPLRQNFPCRNRIISGLSLGVLVVEAASNSGALITADCALEQGREVFALPGGINSENSFGTNNLIKQGAKLVSGIEDILEELNIIAVKAGEKEHNQPGLDGQEAKLYNLLSEEPVCIDEIAEKSKLNIPEISALTVRLQLKKLIKRLAGNQFVRVNDEREKLSHSRIAN